ncbi:uncharacterized protein [Physcomitrium patens]|uniref:NYN domain-containing protein n=1 Tax=Physcomitrium patens TaxID=3218 RepID=A0A2K1JTI3_PHYPA|nr:uncharacterized protein LOC112288343 [Physcomitrium patens]PNR44839.1 hypothetical protein PHYPA_014609 [Physcomitrium patens]|eukprot:XP_024388223.1 uncharacterized protein LOC112288343 [Physcomitrella patens]
MEVSTGNVLEEQELSPPCQTLLSLEEPKRRAKPSETSIGTRDVIVWWDIETCSFSPLEASPPSGAAVQAHRLLRELQSHLNCDQIRVTVNVYGNGGPGSKSGLDTLIASGIILQHRILPCKLPGSETAVLKTMIVDIALWAISNPAPSNVFLISATRDTTFRDLVSGLHSKGYNIFLATKFFWQDAAPDAAGCGGGSGFNPMPRHWSVSKQLFVVRSAPSSRLESADTPSPSSLLPGNFQNLHVS